MSKRYNSFNNDWVSEFPFIKKGKTDVHAICKFCNEELKIADGGRRDICRHAATPKHKKNAEGFASALSIDKFFNKPKCKNIASAAEGAMAFHTVMHQQTFNSMTCTSKLQKLIFSDSKIVAEYTCGKTKCEAIICNVIGKHAENIVFESLQKVEFFSISTDASNHGSKKIFPVIVQYFSVIEGGLQTKLLEFDEVPGETSEIITEYLKAVLDKVGMPTKCIAFCGDNANTNFGGRLRKGCKNVYFRLKQILGEHLLGIGCPAHILHNTVQHGADNLSVDIDGFIGKLFGYFSIYTVRTHELMSFCDFLSSEYRSLLSHSKTRWLSLFPAIERVIKMFDALTLYFSSSDNTPKTISVFLKNPLSLTYLYFLHSQMHVFHAAILKLEKEKISVAESNLILTKTLQQVRDRRDAKFLSLVVKSELGKANISEAMKSEFMNEVDDFYEKCAAYLEQWTCGLKQFDCFNWMLLEDPTWNQLQTSILFLKERNIEIDDNIIFDEFILLQKFLNVNSNSSEFAELCCADKWRLFLSQHVECLQLLKIAQYFFAIPSHNANVERLFSLMNLQWTDDRNHLLVSTVKRLLMVKYNMKFTCDEFYNYLLKAPKLLVEIAESGKYLSD